MTVIVMAVWMSATLDAKEMVPITQIEAWSLVYIRTYISQHHNSVPSRLNLFVWRHGDITGSSTIQNRELLRLWIS